MDVGLNIWNLSSADMDRQITRNVSQQEVDQRKRNHIQLHFGGV